MAEKRIITMKKAAPRNIPPHLHEGFTVNNQIKVVDWYFNDVNGIPNPQRFWSPAHINSLIQKVKRGESVGYVNTTTWLYDALAKHPVDDKSVVIIGSEQPTYECVAIAHGGKPVTIEYKKIECSHPQIKAYTVEEYEKEGKGIQYDASFSISSLEHDGLGRYGDPLNPTADLEAMAKLKTMVKPGGLLYLGVPVGSDVLYWNSMRQYGTVRFPMLIEGWELIDSYGFSPSDLVVEHGRNPKNPRNWKYHQPLFVLKNV